MAVTLRGHSSRSGGDGQDPNVTVDPAVAADDIIVVVVAWNAGPTMTAPDGWTMLDQGGGASVGVAILVRTADGSEAGATISFPLSSPESWAIACGSFFGVESIGAHAMSVEQVGTSAACPAVAAPGAGGLVVRLAGAKGTNAGDVLDFPGVIDSKSSSSTGRNRAAAIASTADSGDHDLTCDHEAALIGASVALEPAAAAPDGATYVWDGVALVPAEAFVWDGTTLVPSVLSIAP